MPTYTDEQLYKALYNAFVENRGDMITVGDGDDFSAAAAAYGLHHGYLTYGGVTHPFDIVDGERVYRNKVHSYFPTARIKSVAH